MRHAAAITLIGFLAACGGSQDPPASPTAGDPLIQAALFDAIATDPDLAAQNGANAVVSLPAPDRFVPSLDLGPAAISRARADALGMVGGAGKMRPAPAASRNAPPLVMIGAPGRTAYIPRSGACAGALTSTAAWAAQLPPSSPVYPRGAVEAASGRDASDCHVRAVTFRTPVALNEVLDFYYTRASSAGLPAAHFTQGRVEILRGGRGRVTFVVELRKLASGATEGNLVTTE